MLTIFDANGIDVYPIANVEPESFCITHKNGGDCTLNFEVAMTDPIYFKIAEELQIQYQDKRYCVKKINNESIECELDFDFLKARFYKEYKRTEDTLQHIFDEHLPSGWSAINAGLVGARRTVELENGGTDYDVIMRALEVYKVAYEWNHTEKTVTVIKPENIQSEGEFLTDELNLRRIDFKGDSTSYITRLYPYGKDGMTIADVNDGKEYVENFEYSDKIICGVWKDERYTVAQNLKDDALERLKTLAFPTRSYECDVIDLAKIDTEYSFLNFQLYRMVTLIDRDRGTKVDHQVVEYKEYPLKPELNVVTLSSVAEKIQTQIKTQISSVTEVIAKEQYKLNEFIRDVDTNYAKIENVYTKGETETRIKSEITQTANEINLEVSKKVGKDEVISRINQSSEAITIQAKKVNLNGYVTLTNLSTEGQTTINGGNLKTGVIRSTNGRLIYDLNAARQTVYDASGNKLMTLDTRGQGFYDGDRYIGYMGRSFWGPNPSKKGIAFNLETEGDYLTWGYRTPGSDSYTVQFIYSPRGDLGYSPGLQLGCNFYGNSYCFVLDKSGTTETVSYNNGGGIRTTNGFIVCQKTGGTDNTIARFNADGNIDFYRSLDMHGYTILNQSDIRLKSNISSTDVCGLDIINALECKKFDWIESGEHQKIGLIAQQVEKIEPSLVDINDDDGHYSLKTVELVPYLIKAVQELSAQVKELQGIKIRKARSTDYYVYQDIFSVEEKIKYTKSLQKKQKQQETEKTPIVIEGSRNSGKI